MRIAVANCGSIWSQTFSYDAFGNINKTGNSSFGATYSPTTNRMTTIGTQTPSYDADGNVTNDFLHSYSWDAYGRPLTIDTVGITYDALGRMVEQNRSGTYTQVQYSPSGFKMQLITNGAYTGFVPLPSGAEAVWPGGPPYYRHPDWLGNSRLTSTTSRTVQGDEAYAPFGETYAASGSPDTSFTGMDQGTVANEYDFPARQYGIQGRWPSPDPAGLLAVDPTDPQTLNEYAYVRNNPLAETDPTGLCGDTGSCQGCAGNWGFEWCYGGSGPQPPMTFPPPSGPFPSSPDDPSSGTGGGFGCEALGMPCGMNFPGGGGLDPSGCTYGGGSCGGMIYGFLDNQGGSGIWYQNPFYSGYGIGQYYLYKKIGPAAQAARAATRQIIKETEPAIREVEEAAKSMEDLMSETSKSWMKMLKTAGEDWATTAGHGPFPHASAPEIYLIPSSRINLMLCTISHTSCSDGEM
jgi:RHS repeat-associated protein